MDIEKIIGGSGSGTHICAGRNPAPTAAKIDRHIEIVTTDTTGMKETAFGSIETCRAIHSALDRVYGVVNINVANNECDLQQIVDRDPDLVVLCVKYIAGAEPDSDIWLSEYFSTHDIPYTGSDRPALDYDSNKNLAKAVLLDAGIATARFFLARPGRYSSEDQLPLGLPLFVKPVDAANGNGIDQHSLVHDFPSYVAKVDEIFANYGIVALVEDVLPGREFTVAVMDNPGLGERIVLPVEIVVPKNANGDRILGAVEKTTNNETLSVVSEPALSAVSGLADAVFSALGARDFGRIDIKMDAGGVPHFIEANLLPGMTPGSSYFPLSFQLNRALSHDSVILMIIEAALDRSERTADRMTVKPVSGLAKLEEAYL